MSMYVSLLMIGVNCQVSHFLLWNLLQSSSYLAAVGAIHQIRSCSQGFSVMLSVSRKQYIKVRMCFEV